MRVLLGDQEQCAGGTRWRTPTLLPFLKGAYGYTEQFGEPRLRKTCPFPDARHRWHFHHASVRAALELPDALENLLADVPLSLRHRSPP